MTVRAPVESDRPAVAVVVPTRGRPLRLRWLLNALQDQTVPGTRFEVVIAHPVGDPAAAVVSGHALAREGRARAVAVSGGRAAARNAGWRAAGAPLVAFTHDDCRPAEDWLERLLAAGAGRPGAVLQGAVEVDPEQGAYLFARLRRTHRSDPVDDFAPACNVAWPREVLERLGGFDESAAVEATDGVELLGRARGEGVEAAPAPEALVYHAVRPQSPAGWLSTLAGTAQLPAAVARAPRLRDGLVLGIAVRPTHLLVPAALAGALAARRRPAAAALAAPWLALLLAEQRGRDVGSAGAVARLPLRAARDLGEFALVTWGAARAWTPCL